MAEFLVDSSESTTELKTNGKVENGLSDSNEAVESVQFFEGVEKLLEIWFTSTDGNNSKRDLRQIPRTLELFKSKN
ncbi:hypothetical protein TSAR_009986 [Trichomalopsis sarcophagae]|uniref:Uncharacterized protein n=1 Tax=Trichomalopsis sarcophagae TaxID=543379 RepID=A0A232FBC2_9HYME|nr:hypothetical protein TSAR_009986 [Trichomalopsis sarcophagae]